jgi:hypothetical protein
MIATIVLLMLLQQPSFFEQSFPFPTGNNGWEEYTMAVDVLRGRRDGLRDRQDLSKSRALVNEFSKVIHLVRAGNKKSLAFPWESNAFMVDERHPLHRFGDVGFIMASRIGVEFAAGNPAAAVEAIEDALAFADRTGRNQAIDGIVAARTLDNVFDSLTENLHKLSGAAARNLTIVFERYVAAPQALIDGLVNEYDNAIAAVPQLLEYRPEDEERFGEVMARIKALTADDRLRLIPIIRSALRGHRESMLEMFKREERFWKAEKPTDPEPMVQYTLKYFSDDGLPQTALRYRTRFRLAALHCRIIEFKRKNNRWPEKLEELGGSKVWYDPASGGPFFYARLTEQSYVLYSLGTSETGRIDLVNRWQPN